MEKSITIRLGTEETEMIEKIAEKMQMSQSAISHQLMVLKRGKLVKIRRSGKNIYYSISDSHVEQILRLGEKHMNE